MAFKRRKRIPGERNWGLYIGLGLIAVVVIGLVLLVQSTSGGDDDEASDDETVETTTSTAEVAGGAPTEGALAAGSGDCSAAGYPGGPLVDQQTLPEDVATRRQLVGEGAVLCDLDLLGGLMDGDFIWELGEPEGPDPAVAAWQAQEDAGEPVLLRLAQIISLDHAQAEGGTYVFPAASQWTADQWASATPEQLAPLIAVYGQDRIDGWVASGSFDGYRVGIREDGTWHYFNGSEL